MGKILFRRIGGRIVPILQKKTASIMLTKPVRSVKFGGLKAAVEKTRALRHSGDFRELERARQWSSFYIKDAISKLPNKLRKLK